MRYEFTSICVKPKMKAKSIINNEGTIRLESIDDLLDLKEGELYKVTIETCR